MLHLSWLVEKEHSSTVTLRFVTSYHGYIAFCNKLPWLHCVFQQVTMVTLRFVTSYHGYIAFCNKLPCDKLPW